jgi:Na+-driven multidrug efflux pump
MAISFAAGPIAGQNFGARHAARVRETFKATAISSTVLMAALSLLCQWQGDALVRPFSSDAEVVRVGEEYLHIISWNFVAVGLVFTCSSIFQGLGNTWPSFISSATRLVVFALPVLWLSHQPGFTIVQVWYVSVASTAFQAIVSLLLVRMEMRSRLEFGPST